MKIKLVFFIIVLVMAGTKVSAQSISIKLLYQNNYISTYEAVTDLYIPSLNNLLEDYITAARIITDDSTTLAYLNNIDCKSKYCIINTKRQEGATMHKKKRALVIGVGNQGTKDSIMMCLKDANDMRNLLLHEGYAVKSLLLAQASKYNILYEVNKIIEEGKEGDDLVIFYSGHGSTLKNKDGFEQDNIDEYWVPEDHREWNLSSYIMDDELNEILRKNWESNITVISNSCHSAGMSERDNHELATFHTNVRFLASSASDQYSYADADGGHFTKRLISSYVKGITLEDWAKASNGILSTLTIEQQKTKAL